VANPVIKFKLVLKHRAHNVDNSEMSPHVNVNECRVFVLRENEPSLASGQELNVGYVIPFEEDILVLRVRLWLKQGTDPSDEGGGPAPEDIDAFVGGFMDEKGHFEFQFVRELFHELIDVITILVEIILHSLLQPLVQVQW